MKKYVLFDMDGVILDSEIGSFGFMQKALAARGISVRLEDLLLHIGKTSRQVAESIIAEYHILETTEDFLQKNRSYGNYYADSPELALMPGLQEFLKELQHRNIRIGVVSSTRAASVVTALNRLRIFSQIEALVCGDMVKIPKPDPYGYLQAAKWLGARPEECVVFEDSPIGIPAAKNAGMRVIGFKGSVIEQDTSAADLEFDTYTECIKAVDRILA